jgi:hypothetical protein
MTKQAMILTRGIGAIAATAVLVTGVSFAALTSNTVTLSDNSFSTDTATLLISNGGAFNDTSVQGFDAGKLAPGQTSDTANFQLENTGDVALAITAIADNINNPSGIDGNQETIHVLRTDGGATGANSEDVTLATLAGGNVGLPGGPVAANTTASYTVSLSLDSGFTGPQGATLSFDTVFTGSQS